MSIKTTTRELFQFDELSDNAKEKARDWFRQCLDSDDYHYVIEDAKEVGKLMGIDIDKIYWSGFSSQGDGACFEGSYSYKKGSVKAVKEYAPLDKELHEIALTLQAIQRRNFYKLEASVVQCGHYMHSGCTSIEIWKGGQGYDWPSNEDNDDLKDALRSFMDWIYSRLMKEDDYINSNESIDENILANEYEFTEEGERA